MVKKVKFLGDATSTQYGSFRTGDIATVSDEFAAHVVDELKIAEHHGTARKADDSGADADQAGADKASTARKSADEERQGTPAKSTRK